MLLDHCLIASESGQRGGLDAYAHPLPIHGYLPLLALTMTSRLLTSTDLAEELNWSLSTIHNRMSQGKPMPTAMQIGGELRFPEDELQACLDADRLSVPTQTQQ